MNVGPKKFTDFYINPNFQFQVNVHQTISGTINGKEYKREICQSRTETEAEEE